MVYTGTQPEMTLRPRQEVEYCRQPVCWCVHENICRTTCPKSASFLCMLPMAVIRPPSGSVVICYVLPVLWKLWMSYFFIIGHMVHATQVECKLKLTHHEAPRVSHRGIFSYLLTRGQHRIGNEIWRQWLLCCLRVPKYTKHFFSTVQYFIEATKQTATRHLQADFDVFGQRSFREHGLDLWNNGRRNHAAVRTDCVGLLANASHDREVMWEVRREDPRYTLLIQLLGTLQVYTAAYITIRDNWTQLTHRKKYWEAPQTLS